MKIGVQGHHPCERYIRLLLFLSQYCKDLIYICFKALLLPIAFKNSLKTIINTNSFQFSKLWDRLKQVPGGTFKGLQNNLWIFFFFLIEFLYKINGCIQCRPICKFFHPLAARLFYKFIIFLNKQNYSINFFLIS